MEAFRATLPPDVDALLDETGGAYGSLQQSRVFNALELYIDDFVDDPTVMFILVGMNADFYPLCSERLRDNEVLLITATSQMPRYLLYASKRLRNDYVSMRTVVEHTPVAFQYVGTRMKRHRPLIIHAIIHAGSKSLTDVMHGIPEDVLRDDETLMRMLIKECSRRGVYASCLFYMSGKLSDDATFMEFAICHTPHAYLYASSRLQHEKHIALLAMRTSKKMGIWMTGCNIPAPLMDDKEVAMEYVLLQRPALAYLSARLQDDFEVVKAAVHADAKQIRYASPRLRADLRMRLYAFKGNLLHGKRLLDDVDEAVAGTIPLGEELDSLMDAVVVSTKRCKTKEYVERAESIVANVYHPNGSAVGMARDEFFVHA